MPRQGRILFARYPVHIVHRGVNRCAIFAGEGDHAFYLGLLQEFLPLAECELHAYVLMTNHVHLLLTPRYEGSAARLMKAVAQRHAQRCNRLWKRTGPLWEGRFKSSLVHSDIHAVNCHRYIEENPVRAGMVRHAAEYRWSSFRANAMGFPCPFLAEHEAVRALHEDPVERRIAYRSLFDAPQPEVEIQRFRAALLGGLPVGPEEFIEQLAARTGRRTARRNRQAAIA